MKKNLLLFAIFTTLSMCAFAQATYTGTATNDSWIEKGTTTCVNGDAIEMKTYTTNSDASKNKTFYGLMSFEFTSPNDGNEVESAILRTTTKYKKGDSELKVYGIEYVDAESTNYNSMQTVIEAALAGTPIATFRINGYLNKAIFDDGISNDFLTVDKWQNIIDLTNYVRSLSTNKFTLLFVKTYDQDNSTQIYSSEATNQKWHTNINSGAAIADVDIRPLFTVKYSYKKVDIIDYSSSVVTAKQDGLTINNTVSDTEQKNVLSFTPASVGEVGLTFNANDYTIDNTQNFFVIETNSGAINSDGNWFKCRSLTIDGTDYEANDYDMKVVSDVNGRQVVIFSLLGQAYNKQDKALQLFNKINGTANGVKMSVSKTTIYFTVANTNEVTIYRAGYYNLGEILALYPSLKTKNWRFAAANGLYLEIPPTNNTNNGNDNGVISIKGENTSKSNYNVFKQQMRALGTLPNNYTLLNYNSFSFEDEIEPTTEDLLTQINIPQIQLSESLIPFFPTLTPKKVKANGKNYWAYKDGVAALKSNFYVDNDYTNNITDFTRKFLHGYNSGILPFELDVTSLPEGWTAYVFRDYTTEGDLRFEKKDYTIAANTPFFIKVPDTATEGLYVISSTNSEDPIDNPANYITTEESNGARFVGSYINEVATNNYGTKKYGIDKSGQPMLMKSTTKTSYYRAFIAMGEQATPAKSIIFDDNTITGINDISALNDNGQTANDDAVYDLSGRKVADNYTLGIKHHALPKGIYIYKGKKIVMK